MSKLENLISNSHHRKFGFITGSGTAGIYIALKSLGLKNNLIIDDANFPNLISLPLFSKEYNKEIYINTRKFSLSLGNSFNILFLAF